jgi:prevent-host-death family protein
MPVAEVRGRPKTTTVEHMPKRSKVYGSDDARAHLPELLELAHKGASTVITKRGRPYAMIAPLDASQPSPHLLLSMLKGSGAGLWGADSRQTIASLRDEWE